MNDKKLTPDIGTIEWCDLTVTDAEAIKDFYCNLVGWKASAVSMGEYNDFNINTPETANTVAGICHARGTNSQLPSQWLMYVRVKDVPSSALKCEALGGTVLDGPKTMGSSQFCVIQDPQGAVLALISD